MPTQPVSVHDLKVGHVVHHDGCRFGVTEVKDVEYQWKARRDQPPMIKTVVTWTELATVGEDKKTYPHLDEWAFGVHKTDDHEFQVEGS